MPKVTGAANWFGRPPLGGQLLHICSLWEQGVMRQIDPREVTNGWEKTFLLVLFRCSLKEGFGGCVRPKTGPKRQKTG